MDLILEADARKTLLAHDGKATSYLRLIEQWKTGGEYNATWQFADNIPRHELLRRSRSGLLQHLAFKGGPAIRKLYLGGQGWFSLGLDFTVSPEIFRRQALQVCSSNKNAAAR